MKYKGEVFRRILSVFLILVMSISLVEPAGVRADESGNDGLGYAEFLKASDGMDTGSEDYIRLKADYTASKRQEGSKAYSLSDGSLLSGEYIEFHVGSGGRFTMGTTLGNPERPDDDYQKLLYGHPGGTTSCTTIRVDGSDEYFDSYNSVFDTADNSNTSCCVYQDVQIEQKLKIVENNSTGREDVIQVTYTAKNRSDAEKSVGIRIMLDTMLGTNDAAPFRIPGYGISQRKRNLRERIFHSSGRHLTACPLPV